jgi:hypothetical protein
MPLRQDDELESNMDIDERESNVNINEEQWMDIDADDSSQKDDLIHDATNNDSGDKNTSSRPIRPVKKASKPTRSELRKTQWYRFNPVYLQKYKSLHFDKEKDVAYCSYPQCKA